MLKVNSEKALVLNIKPFGENRHIISFLTLEQGRYTGLYRRKIPPCVGSFISVSWQARLQEQLGLMTLETGENIYAQVINNQQKLLCLGCLCKLLHTLLPERQDFLSFIQNTFDFVHHLLKEDFLERYVHWELDLLKAIGFGLDLSHCAGGGDNQNLAFVSPKSGTAVSFEKGVPYREKLLELPKFLCEKQEKISNQEIKKGLNLTGFFLEKHAISHSLPDIRYQLLNSLKIESYNEQ